MGIRDILITGRTAKLPGDYAPQAAGGGCAQVSSDQRVTVRPPAEPVAGREIVLDLPWPPSVNTYYRRHGHTIHVSAAGKRFSKLVALSVRTQFKAAPIEENVAVLLELFAPKRGPYGNNGYDVDNRVKAVLDALTRAELWTDDKIVRDVRVVDCGRDISGKVRVHVWPM